MCPNDFLIAFRVILQLLGKKCPSFCVHGWLNNHIFVFLCQTHFLILCNMNMQRIYEICKSVSLLIDIMPVFSPSCYNQPNGTHSRLNNFIRNSFSFLGMVTQAWSLWYLGGRDQTESWFEASLGKTSWDCISTNKNWTWWHMPVIPAMWDI
jgi:hypothetical protein